MTDETVNTGDNANDKPAAPAPVWGAATDAPTTAASPAAPLAGTVVTGETAAELDAAHAANAEADAAKVQNPAPKAGEPVTGSAPQLGRDWAESQAAANGEELTTFAEGHKPTGAHGAPKGGYYAGPKADSGEVVQEKPTTLQYLEQMLAHPFAGLKKRFQSYEERETANLDLAKNAAQTAAIANKSITANAELPNADADGEHKTAVGSNVNWSAGA